jgi:hypothetical protein
LDERARVSAPVEQLARWWTSASTEQRFEAWQKACQENRPPLATLRIAAILAEAQAGEVEEG